MTEVEFLLTISKKQEYLTNSSDTVDNVNVTMMTNRY